MKKNTVKLNESQLRSMVMEVTSQTLKGMKSATKDVHAKANEQSPEEKKYNRATSKPKPSHWKPLGKNDYENMRNGNVDGLSDKAYRKAKYEELKEDTNMDTPKFDNVDNDQIPADGNYTDILVPEHCLNYLVNGDLTGYEDDEIEAMQRFESKWAGRIANGLIIGDICIPIEGRHPSFEPKNDVYGWLGCDCYRFMVPLKGSEEDTVNNNEPVKLSESQLRQMIAESVKKVLKESFEDYYEYIDDNIKKILEHLRGISDALFQIHETANVKGKDFVNFDNIITTLMMDVADFRDDVMGMGVKYDLVKVRKTFY